MPAKYIFTFSLLLSFLSKPVQAQISVGDTIIPFNLPDTAGLSVSSDDFAGQILLLNFFATWCGPCKIEAPQLEDSIWQVYKDRAVTVLGLDFQESKQKLVEFIYTYNLTYPMLRDTAGAVFKAYGFRGFPSSVIIDRNGKVVHVEEGFDIAVFIQVIDSLLGITGIKERMIPRPAPRQLTLMGNYPNPFNPSTRIVFRISTSGHVQLSLYNILGQRLETLVSAKLNAGSHSVLWDASAYSAGIYFYKIRAAGEEKSGKIVYRK